MYISRERKGKARLAEENGDDEADEITKLTERSSLLPIIYNFISCLQPASQPTFLRHRATHPQFPHEGSSVSQSTSADKFHGIETEKS